MSRITLLLLIAIGLVIAGAVVWRKVIREHVIPRNFGVVEPGRIYRSGSLTESTLRKLHDEYHIKTVVDLGAYALEPPKEAAMQKCAQDLGINRHAFNLNGDGTGDPNIYVQTLQLLSDPANEPILVMCNAGAQRTGAAVMLFRHVIQGRDIQQCYPESFNFRHDPGEDWIMLAYLADWAPAIAEAYRHGETVEQAAARMHQSPAASHPQMQSQTQPSTP